MIDLRRLQVGKRGHHIDRSRGSVAGERAWGRSLGRDRPGRRSVASRQRSAFDFEPTAEVAANYGVNAARLNEASTLVEEHLDEIRSAWARHFPG